MNTTGTKSQIIIFRMYSGTCCERSFRTSSTIIVILLLDTVVIKTYYEWRIITNIIAWPYRSRWGSCKSTIYVILRGQCFENFVSQYRETALDY